MGRTLKVNEELNHFTFIGSLINTFGKEVIQDTRLLQPVSYT